MIRKVLLIFIALVTASEIYPQSLQDFLRQVEGKNPEIIAYSRLLEARRFEARTGNTPPDPFISAGILPGSPDVAGTKKTWNITQSFSFPTKYLLQKKINRTTILLAEQEFNLGKLQILLDAEESYLDLGYKTRYLEILNSRKEGYKRLQSAWKMMLESGQTTIMDYNRIMLELSVINLEIARTEADIKMIRERLAFLSGDSASLMLAGEFPEFTEPDAESLLKEKPAVHPSYLIPELEYEIGVQEVKLSRTGSLPEFQLGYGSESVPGETYTGPSGGISIPLWSNSGNTKAASARAEHLSAQRDAVLQKLKSGLRNQYSEMKALQRSISELNMILETSGGTKYLDSALEAGEIPITVYFNYVEPIYMSEDKLLELENEYNKSIARLTDHELLR